MWCTDLDNRLSQIAHYHFAHTRSDVFFSTTTFNSELQTDSVSHRNETHMSMLLPN